MFEPSFWQNLIAIVGPPIAIWVTALGTGLLLERLTRARLHNALLLPLGLAGGICLTYSLYALHLSDGPVVVLLCVLSGAGFLLSRGSIRSRLNPGLPGVAGLGAYLLFMLPVLVAGHWLWVGYGFDDDTAVQFMLTASLKLHGTAGVSGASTMGAYINSYLGSAYPLGSHAELATISGLLHTPPEVLYQGYLSVLAASIAIAVAAAAESVVGAARAAVLGFASASAALFYQFALQGNIKEIATGSMTVATFALVGAAFRERRPWSGAAVCAVPMAATLGVYGAAGAPYVLGAIGGVALVLVVAERQLPRPAWIGPAILGAGLVVLLSIPAISGFATLFNVAKAVVGSTNPSGDILGELARPLPISQMSGVWLSDDFRLQILAHPAAGLTNLASALILLALIPGVLVSIRRKDAGPLVATITTALVLLIVVPRVTPYAFAKIYAIGSPVVVWVAGLGVLALGWRGLRLMAAALGLLLVVAIFASDLLEYHWGQVSPTSRMLAIEATGEYFAGRGPVLWDESDPYAAYFGRAAKINLPFATLTPQPAQIIDGASFFAEYFDLEQMTLPYVEGFPYIVTRRTPDSPRPPANYRLVYSNSYYDGWAREETPKVVSQLPLEVPDPSSAPWQTSTVATCSELGSFVTAAPKGSALVAAQAPLSVGFEPLSARSRPFSWGLDEHPYGAVFTVGPGFVHEQVSVPRAGVYQAWVQGSFPRPIQVEVDQRAVGTVSGLDSLEQWSYAGLVRLTAGAHELAIHRGGGGIYPGDGSTLGEVGYVMLELNTAVTLRSVPFARWRSLCGVNAQWVELVKP
jgi:hypothetical protein